MRGTTVTRRRALVMVAAGVLSPAVVGCTDLASAGQTVALERRRIRVGVIPAVSAAGLYIAQQQGYFGDEGLAVEIVPIQGSGPAMPALIRGSVDITFGNYVSYMRAQATGVASLRILAEGYVAGPDGFMVLVGPHSRITTVQALRGKTIGTNAKGDVSQLLIDSVFAVNGMSVSEVKFKVMPFPLIGAALNAGQIDAGWFTEPYLSQAEETFGAVALFDTDQGATTSWPVSGAACLARWAHSYPKTAAAFVRALDRGQAVADSSRAAVEAVLPLYIKGVTRETTSLMNIGSYPTSTNEGRLQRVADEMQAQGLASERVNVAQMLGT